MTCAGIVYWRNEIVIIIYGVVMSLFSSATSFTIPGVYVAIDFETSDYTKDSACAVGLARIEDGKIVSTLYSLLRPPNKRIRFTDIHGITWEDVQNAPTFKEFSPKILQFVAGVDGFVAHNASFDQGVLAACCAGADIAWFNKAFYCTCKGARAKLGLKKNKLSDICTHLRIDLQHHHAGSDAIAAAHVFIHLCSLGHSPDLMQVSFKG